MALPSEVGLRLLLSPFGSVGSNVVIRTACCSVGTILPVYSTFKAIENKNEDEQQKWLLYWAAYGSFSVAEVFADKILSWFPLYYHLKFAFLVWLQLPSVEGARQLYMGHMRPFLLRHQARLDRIVETVYGEMTKFVTAHQTEIQFARTMLWRILAFANQLVRDIISPKLSQVNGRIEGPVREVQESDSENDD